MSEDLLDRLDAFYKRCCFLSDDIGYSSGVIEEAIDEIRRLREAGDQLERVLASPTEKGQPYHPDRGMTSDALRGWATARRPIAPGRKVESISIACPKCSWTSAEYEVDDFDDLPARLNAERSYRAHFERAHVDVGITRFLYKREGST